MAIRCSILPGLFANSQPLRKGKISGVYGIIHSGTGRIYIGSTENLLARREVHKYDIRTKTHCCKELEFDAWSDCAALDFVVIERVYGKRELVEREQFWINFYNSFHPEFGYNMSNADRTGYKQSKEHIEKVASSHRGLKRGPISEETRRKISKAGIGRENASQIKAVIGTSSDGDEVFFRSMSQAGLHCSGRKNAASNIVAAIKSGGTAFGRRWKYA